MKQLKFMLAAATAIGLATAAQAADPLFTDTFEDGVMPAGYSYVPVSDNDNDNESAIVDNGYNSSKALQVNTGTNPLLRALDYDGKANAVNLTEAKLKSVYIDTMVQFTVTPDGDPVTAGDEDKLMIYLREVPAAGETPASTKLMVKSRTFTPANGRNPAVFGDKDDYELKGITVVPGEWYHLVVEASLNDAQFTQFRIKMAKGNEDLVLLTNEAGLIATDNTLFPSLQGAYSEENAPKACSLEYVGFAGEGMVDDLAFTKDVEGETAVDFTFTWTTAGISSVTYTIGDAAAVSVTSGVKIENLAANTVLTIAITPADWYKVNDGATLTYTADKVGASADLDGLVTKLAEVTTDPETGAEKIVVSETTTPAQVGVVAGSFKDEPAGSAELNKALTWATTKAGATAANAGAKVGELDFSNTEETPAEQAYLLNCAPTAEALQEAKDNFKFPEIVPGQTPAIDDSQYNGTVTVKGKKSLSDAEWVKDCPNASFFKAFLTK